ncbi:TorF family putative porin [Aliikangiella coralliicola]|uniref:Porin n=1 Tax=Aliikangiella coralliicola TaxID=2592383 RepID=A0A545UDZ7_9GAMM|nr:TorF family putative porin [Aliikangiella coralliicola]TQV87680.1 hypothetical protein FLL46_09855 [Aliikangiella coralliicola]
MKARTLGLLAASLIGIQANNSHADSLSYEGNLTLASRYMFRGFDLSDSDPVVQGDFTISHASGFSIGAWASQYDVVTDDGIETDLVVSYETEISDSVSVNIGLTEYTYSGDTDSTTEYYAGLSVENFGVTYYRDTDLKNDYYSLDAEFDLMTALSLAFHIGHNSPDNGVSHEDYNIGLGYAVNRHLSLSANYSLLELDGADDDNNFAVSVNYLF